MAKHHAGFVLLSCAFALAQPSSPKHRELSLTRTGSADQPVFHLRNEYSAAATAWILACQTEPLPGRGTRLRWHWSDQALGLEGKLIEPGQEIDITIPNARIPMLGNTAKACDDFHLVAAVFEDGTVSGDLGWINAIAAERRKAYEDIAKATGILEKAISARADRSDVIRQFEEWRSRELPKTRGGKLSPNHGESNGSRVQNVPAGESAGVNVTAPERLLAKAAVPGVALWLLRENGKDLSDAVKRLTAWRDALCTMSAVTRSVQTAPAVTRARTAPARALQPELVGKPAPDFTLKDVNGRELALKDLRGKTLFLNFWATWCEPCRKEMPQIKALHDEFKGRGLVVICVDFSESAEKARKYFEQQHYSFWNLMDPTKDAFKSYGGGSIPKVFLIDEAGIVRYFQQGYNSRQNFRAELMKLWLK